MARKSFTDEQIISALRLADSGVPIVEVCRKFGVTQTSFFRWRKQFAARWRLSEQANPSLSLVNWTR
jgi:transposase-like protein